MAAAATTSTSTAAVKATVVVCRFFLSCWTFSVPNSWLVFFALVRSILPYRLCYLLQCFYVFRLHVWVCTGCLFHFDLCYLLGVGFLYIYLCCWIVDVCVFFLFWFCIRISGRSFSLELSHVDFVNKFQ